MPSRKSAVWREAALASMASASAGSSPAARCARNRRLVAPQALRRERQQLRSQRLRSAFSELFTRHHLSHQPHAVCFLRAEPACCKQKRAGQLVPYLQTQIRADQRRNEPDAGFRCSRTALPGAASVKSHKSSQAGATGHGRAVYQSNGRHTALPQRAEHPRGALGLNAMLLERKLQPSVSARRDPAPRRTIPPHPPAEPLALTSSRRTQR